MARKNIGKIVSTSLLKEGDVIMSPDFAYCRGDSDDLYFDKAIKDGVEHPRKSHAFGSGSFDHVDKKRSQKKYVVDRISERQGETTLMSNSPMHYHERDIFVKQLHEDGSYNEMGEAFCFSAQTDRTHYLAVVTLVGHMKRTFV